MLRWICTLLLFYGCLCGLAFLIAIIKADWVHSVMCLGLAMATTGSAFYLSQYIKPEAPENE